MKSSKTLVITISLIIILLGVIIYQYGYMGVHERISSIKEEQDVKSGILRKYATRISEIPSLEKRLASLKETREAYNEEFMKGETEAIISASFQETVRGLITSMGGRIMSERIGQGSDLGRFKVISIGIDASMPDVKALSNALYAIETYKPSLFIKDIAISIRDFGNPRELTVKLEVSALMGGT